jgi:hypothetical protein
VVYNSIKNQLGIQCDAASRRIEEVMKKSIVVVGPAIAIWACIALFGLLRDNPFQVATEAAAARAQWPLSEVRFERGRYLFLGVMSTVEAEVTPVHGEGEERARIKLTHVPLRGWQVTEFELARSPRATEGG